MKNSVKIFVFIIFALFACVSTYYAVSKAAGPRAVTSVKASHILVNSEQEAIVIKSKIDNGERFETLAKKYSKCPSGSDGGDLGYFGRGQMVKEFENAAFELPVDKVSEPVKTQFGWHLIKVYDKK